MNPLFDAQMIGGSHEDICRYAEGIFQRIRQMLVEKVGPTTLRSAFLDPIRTEMDVDMSIDIFSRNDRDFLHLFLGKTSSNFHSQLNTKIYFALESSVVHELEQKCAQLSRRAAGLEKCKKEFQELSSQL